MDTEIAPPPLPGDRVGSYILGEVLGVGGNATVYRATSDIYPTTALKILHPGKIGTEERRRLKREFLTLKGLRHPGVVSVYEFGEHGDYPWIAMEFIDGIDLDTQIARWRAEPSADRFAEVERIFRELCEALAYVHEQKLIHRDLKPSNVLLTANSQPKLSDFGVVKTQGAHDTYLTQTRRLVGTVAFMAPELIMGDTVDSRVDLYSLGAVLYVLLTLEKPIEADSIPGYLARHLTHVPRPPSELDPRVPRHLERVCSRLLLKDPAQRFATARQVLEMLDDGVPDVRAPVHGRDALLSSMLVRFDTLKRGAGGVVLVRGSSGSGKSTLLRELVERARAAGNDIARCDGDDPNPMRTLADQLPARSPNEDPAARLVSLARQQPLTLVIDDVEKMSRAELTRLTGLTRDLIAVEGERLLIIASHTRDYGPAAAFITGAATGLTPERIDLPGLNRRASIALVRDRGVSGAAGAALGHRLYEEQSGHPGAILEQINALVSAGWLAGTAAGGLRPARSIDELREAPLPVPDHIRHERENQLRALSDEARTILNVLVVLNMEGTTALVGRIADLPPSAVERAAATLAAHGLVVRRQEGVAEVLALNADQPRNLLYAIIDPNHRSALHRQVAVTLRQRSRRRLGPMAEIIARHLLQGGEVAEAWPLLLVAAQRKLRVGKLKSARRLLRLAMDARPAAEAALDPELCRKHRRLQFALEAECRELGGDLTGAISAWQQALDAAREEGDPQTMARIQSGLGLAQNARGDVNLATEGLEAAIDSLQRGDPMWPRVARALASARLESGHIDGAERLWGELFEMSRETDSPMRRAEALAGLGQIALARGQVLEGRRRMLEALPTLMGRGADPEQARRILTLAELELCAGRLHAAQKHTEEADSMARDVQRLITCVRAQGLTACAAWALGDDAYAARAARGGEAMLAAAGTPNTAEELRARLPLARAWALLGNVDKARALLPSTPLEVAPGLDDPTGQQLALYARLSAHLEPGVAMEAARAALDRASARLPWVAARVALDIAHTMRTLERITAAKVSLSRADAVLKGDQLKLLALEAANLRSELSRGAEGSREADVIREELFIELDEPSGFWTRWEM
ncbi:MAG: protein kinase [Myxococcota bacterium]